MSEPGAWRRGLLLSRPWVAVSTVIAAATAAGVVTTFARAEDWVGWLPTTVSAFEQSAAWMPSVLAPAAAWWAGHPRAFGLSEWVAVSPRTLGQRRGALATLLGVGVLGALVLSGVLVGGLSTYYGLPGGLHEVTMLLGVPTFAAYVVVWTSVGFWLGESLRRELALPLAAIVPYLAFAWLTAQSSSTLGALAVGGSRVYDELRPTDGVLASRGACWVLLAATVVLWLLQQRRVSRVLPWLASLAAAACLVQGPAVVMLPATPVCEGTAPRACVEASFETMMPRYRAALDEVWPTVPEPLRPALVVSIDEVLPKTSGRMVVHPVSDYTDPARLIDQDLFTVRLGDSLFLTPCLAKPLPLVAPGEPGMEADPSYDAAQNLVVWWRESHGVPVGGEDVLGSFYDPDQDPERERRDAEAAAFSAWSEEQRAAWFEANAAAIRTCTATGPVGP